MNPSDRNHFFNSREHELRLFIVLAAALLVMLVVSLVLGIRDQRRDHSVPSGAALRNFPEISIEAKSAYVYDLHDGSVLYSKNDEVRLPLASITKVMAALVAKDMGLPNGVVTVTDEALRAEGDSGLRLNERWSLRELLDFSLVSSSNDGMRAIALALGSLSDYRSSEEEIVNDFVFKMNEKSKELRLKDTYFWNEHGLDQSEDKNGAYGSARDVAALFEHIIINYPDLLEATKESSQIFHSLDNHAYLATNTNRIAFEIPGLIASKTGYTGVAGGNLAIAFNPELGRPIVIVVLGSSESGRFEDMRKLISETMSYIGQ